MSVRLSRATAEDILLVAKLVAASPSRGQNEADLLLDRCAVSDVWIALLGEEDVPAGLWGAATFDGDSRTAIYWMMELDPSAIATELQRDEDGDKDGDAEAMTRLAVEELLDRFETLENYVEPRNRASLALLEAAGFTIEPPVLDAVTGVLLHRVWVGRTDLRPTCLIIH